MTDLETYCLRFFMSITNGLGLLLTPDDVHSFGNDNVKSVNMVADGLEAVIEFEGKEYKIRIIPLSMKILSDTYDNGNHLTRFHEETIKCEKCDGKGYIDYDDNLCDECGGEGYIEREI